MPKFLDDVKCKNSIGAEISLSNTYQRAQDAYAQAFKWRYYGDYSMEVKQWQITTYDVNSGDGPTGSGFVVDASGNLAGVIVFINDDGDNCEFKVYGFNNITAYKFADLSIS